MLKGLREKWPGSGSKDKQIVREMLEDQNCHHWSECYQFFEHLVKLSRLPVYMHEDVVQEAFLSVMSYLPTFRLDCKFSTWLTYIVRSRIADAMRDLARARKFFIPANPSEVDDENETDQLPMQDSYSPEEICISNEGVDKVVSKIREYSSKHANSERNLRILGLLYFKQYRVAEIAKELGMKQPAVRAVITAFKRFLESSDEQDSAPDSTD